VKLNQTKCTNEVSRERGAFFMEANAVREFVIFAVPDGYARLRISACPVKEYPLPFGAEVITRVVGPILT
jgi:hypothetical protein